MGDDDLTVRAGLALAGGRVVRRRLAPMAQGRVVAEDPVAYAHGLAAAGATSFAVVDLDAADAGRPVQVDLAARIAEATGAEVAYRGGLVGPGDVERAREAGLAPLVLDTAAFGDPAVLRWAVDALGARLVVALDADGDRVRLPFGSRSAVALTDAAAELAYRGVTEFAYTDLGRAGTLGGPNLDALRRLLDAVERPVGYEGGVASAADVRALAGLGRATLRAVTVATALYDGRLTIAEARAAAVRPPEGGSDA